jgi:colicin import membrane protein
LEELAAKAAAEEAAEAEALAAKKAAEEAAAQEAAAEAEAEELARRNKAAEEASRAMGTTSGAIDEETGDATVTAAPKGPSAERNQAQATPRQPQRVPGFDPEVEGSLHGSSVDVQVSLANFVKPCLRKNAAN